MRKTIILVFALIGLISIMSSFTNLQSDKEVVILKLMGKKLESAYYIDNGEETKVRGLTGDVALENYLNQGWEVIGTSVASDAGRFSVVYTLIK
tara:strand:- start:1623 stop:1904 length:282 start_codon:yes stop_codon:yes gene_type:complete